RGHPEPLDPPIAHRRDEAEALRAPRGRALGEAERSRARGGPVERAEREVLGPRAPPSGGDGPWPPGEDPREAMRPSEEEPDGVDGGRSRAGPDPGGALRVTEIYRSIQGESSYAGLACVFVRLTGCALRCVWCDSTYTFTGGEWMSLDAVLQRVRE